MEWGFIVGVKGCIIIEETVERRVRGKWARAPWQPLITSCCSGSHRRAGGIVHEGLVPLSGRGSGVVAAQWSPSQKGELDTECREVGIRWNHAGTLHVSCPL